MTNVKRFIKFIFQKCEKSNSLKPKKYRRISIKKFCFLNGTFAFKLFLTYFLQKSLFNSRQTMKSPPKQRYLRPNRYRKLSIEQRIFLEKAYAINKYPKIRELKEYAEIVEESVEKLMNWFKNMRKKQVLKGEMKFEV